MAPSHQQYGSRRLSSTDLQSSVHSGYVPRLRSTENTIFLNSRDQRQLLSVLSLILLLAFLLRLYVAVSFPNINHPDEVFQYIEQAHRLVFKYGFIPWEYRDAIRSWLVPGFLAGLLKIFAILGVSQPSIYLFLVAATLSALSLSVVFIGFLWGLRTQGTVAGIITATVCAVWYELI